MLIWVVSKGEDTFRTNSLDIYSVAFMLSSLGFDLLRVAVEKAKYEDVGVITLIKMEYALWSDHVVRLVRDLRRGMRVPLLNMEDAMALWPDNPERNNRRQMIFINGMSSAKDISFYVCLSFKDSRSARLAIWVASTIKGFICSTPPTVFILMDRYFLIPTNRLFSALSKLIKSGNVL
jgi:hypothetical protein